MSKLKILVVGDDIEALIASFILSEQYNVTLVGSIYENINEYYNEINGNNVSLWNNVVATYINKIPFINYRNRNFRRTEKIEKILEYFDMQVGYDEDDLEAFFNAYLPYKHIEKNTVEEDISESSYKSLSSIYNGEEYLTISKYIIKYKDKLEKYRNKVWPKNKNSRSVLQDPEIFASQNLCRVYFFNLIKKLIEFCKPTYYDLFRDPTCKNIEHKYDYVFFTDKLYNEECSLAYHLSFECFSFKNNEVFQYDNIYFNDDSNILRIYSNGDFYHALMKYETNKSEKEYQNELSNYVGNCLFFGTGSIIKNHILINKKSYSILPNTKNKKKQFFYIIDENDRIYSRTTLGYVESLDMFVEAVEILIDELDK